MAEVLALAASVAGILGLTVQITQCVKKISSDLKDAPADMRSLIAELQTLKTVLSELQANLLYNPDFKDSFNERPSALLGDDALESSEISASINSCKTELEDLLFNLSKGDKKHGFGWDRLNSLSLVKKAQKSMDRLRSHCQYLNNMVSIDHAALGSLTLKETRQARNEQKEWHDTERNQKILTWLSRLIFEEKQRDVLSKRHPGTGKWLLNNDDFKAWRNGSTELPSTLWCSGIPGAGKTVMTAIIIEHLQQIFTGDDVSVAYVFCDYQDRRSQTTLALLSSLVQQLALQCKDMPQEISDAYDKCSHGQISLSQSDCSELLISVSSRFRRSFVVIDALDELLTNDDEGSGLRLDILDELLRLQEQRSSRAYYSLFVTSRENRVIQQSLARSICVEILANSEDVESYIRSYISDTSKFRFADKVQADSDLGNEIVARLTESAQGIFLLPRLQLGKLGCQISVRNLRNALKTLPNSMTQTYVEAMDRIKAQVPEYSKLALLALSWISHALRPLRVAELCQALAVQPEDRAIDDEALVEESLIVSVSAGLITIDVESKIIRLVHFTVEEFFRDPNQEWFPDANSIIAGTCITYLSFDVFESRLLCSNKEMKAWIKANPLLDYASRYWGIHVSQGSNNDVEDQTFKFLMNKRTLPLPGQLLQIDLLPKDRKFGEFSYYLNKVSELLSAAHFSTHFNLISILNRLLDRKVTVDSRDGYGRTPLSWAASSGQDTAMKLLIDSGEADLNSRDCYGKTPLACAVRNSHESAVLLLLAQQDMIADSKDENGQTPLSVAAEEGHEAIVKLLLTRIDVKADSRDKFGRTPLSSAAVAGHEAIVKLLLTRTDVKADSRDSDGQTPLSYAAVAGHEAIVKLFLNRTDVIADSKDTNGRSPLSFAAEYGYERVVELLLARTDIKADSEDKGGRTPLSYAAQSESVVKLFVNRTDVQVNFQDHKGQTPLIHAAIMGHIQIVKLLFARADIETHSRDIEGKSALFYAAWYGHLDIVVSLLLREGVITTERKREIKELAKEVTSLKGYNNRSITELLMEKAAEVE